MTNAGLKAMFAKEKDNLCFILLDNSIYVLFQYDGRSRIKWEEAVKRLPENQREEKLKQLKKMDVLNISDIKFETFDGEDFFGVPMTQGSSSTLIDFIYWHRTDSIQGFGSVTDEFTDYRIDPVLFR